MHFFARLVLLLALTAVLPAQLAFDGDFENGNLDGWRHDAPYYTLNTNNPPGGWQWLHCRVRGVLGQAPQFRTNTADSDDVYRSYHRMVWRYGGQDGWRFMDQGSKPGDGYYYFSNNAPFERDVVFIAYWQPYTVQQAEVFRDAVVARRSPWLWAGEGTAIARSQQGRPIHRLKISDRTLVPKQHVVVVGRQHGYESLGNYAIEGLVEFLLSEDPGAVRLRRVAVFHVVPMTNPDAVYHGWTREGRDKTGTSPVDFNRDWPRDSVQVGGAPSSSREVETLRNRLRRETGGSAVITIDVHSHGKGSSGLGWYWWAYGDGVRALELITAIWSADQAAHGGSSVYSWPSFQVGRSQPTLGAWGGPFGTAAPTGTLDGVGFTLEPIAAPFGQNRTTARIRAAGAAIGRGLAAVL